MKLALALAITLPLSDDWQAAEARTHVEAAADRTLDLATGPVSFPDPGRDSARRARRQERKPPRPRKPSPAGAAPLRSVARRSLGARDHAAIRAAAAPLVAQLETELGALKDALRGPDPEFACRIALDARRAIPAAIDQFAAEMHGRLPLA